MNGRSVVVVDSACGTDEVLKAVFEPRGLSVNRMTGPQNLLPPVPRSILVVDTDAERVPDLDAPGWRDVPQVIIGTWHADRCDDSPDGGARELLSKPFRYAELVAAIERLVDNTRHC